MALILHTVELLERLKSTDDAQLGVLINADEEIGSPGSGAFITQRGSEYDAVLSFEGGGVEQDMVRLATSSSPSSSCVSPAAPATPAPTRPPAAMPCTRCRTRS